ncbi:MAG: hypothetical protein LAO07_09170 [Acidobacteriia bacterium]|nr:hypothetical protein [Terriglobia bacterium]
MESIRRVRRFVRERGVLALGALLILASAPTAQAWGRGTNLVRKYKPGQRMVYQTSIETHAKIHSTPEGLKAFLPPLPTELRTRQQNTVTVRSVSADGVAEVENRFDRFEVQSNLPELLPDEARDSARTAQEEFGKRVSGRVLTVHYDRNGRLLGFEGADEILGDLDGPLQETARQMLRLFLEQMSGRAFYPGHRVKKGDEWKQKLDTLPTDGAPFSVEGESTMRYAGRTRYRGVKAAIIDFKFTNLLRPSMESLRAGPLAQLEAHGMGLDMKIDGQGQGRVIVALDDGRVLQNHATLQQRMSAKLKTTAGIRLPVEGPLTLEVDSETRLELDGEGKPGH